MEKALENLRISEDTWYTVPGTHYVFRIERDTDADAPSEYSDEPWHWVTDNSRDMPYLTPNRNNRVHNEFIPSVYPNKYEIFFPVYVYYGNYGGSCQLMTWQESMKLRYGAYEYTHNAELVIDTDGARKYYGIYIPPRELDESAHVTAYRGIQLEKLRQVAESICDEWTTYLSGEVYGFRIAEVGGELFTDWDVYSGDVSHADDVDSVWSIYGRQSVIDEVKAEVESYRDYYIRMYEESFA